MNLKMKPTNEQMKGKKMLKWEMGQENIEQAVDKLWTKGKKTKILNQPNGG